MDALLQLINELPSGGQIKLTKRHHHNLGIVLVVECDGTTFYLGCVRTLSTRFLTEVGARDFIDKTHEELVERKRNRQMIGCR